MQTKDGQVTARELFAFAAERVPTLLRDTILKSRGLAGLGQADVQRPRAMYPAGSARDEPVLARLTLDPIKR
jgi:hypothetical protein